MSLYAGRKKKFKISVASANRILQFSGAALDSAGCEDCGGRFIDCSPRTVDHLAGCRGVERYSKIYREFMDALKG